MLGVFVRYVELVDLLGIEVHGQKYGPDRSISPAPEIDPAAVVQLSVDVEGLLSVTLHVHNLEVVVVDPIRRAEDIVFVKRRIFLNELEKTLYHVRSFFDFQTVAIDFVLSFHFLKRVLVESAEKI